MNTTETDRQELRGLFYAEENIVLNGSYDSLYGYVLWLEEKLVESRERGNDLLYAQDERD